MLFNNEKRLVGASKMKGQYRIIFIVVALHVLSGTIAFSHTPPLLSLSTVITGLILQRPTHIASDSSGLPFLWVQKKFF